MGHLLSCIKRCRLVDVVRIVHINGHVEQISKPVRAEEVMKANPQHFVGQSDYHGVVRQTAVLAPDAELQLGQIYFLLPSPMAQSKVMDSISSLSLRYMSMPRPKSSEERLPDELQGLDDSLEETDQGLDDSLEEGSFLAAAPPPTFHIEKYDGVTNFVISKHYVLADFLAENTTKEDWEEFEERHKKDLHDGQDCSEQQAMESEMESEKGEEVVDNEEKLVSNSLAKRVYRTGSWRPALDSILEVS